MEAEENRGMLEGYSWPGNVRELVALVKRRIRLGDDVVGELSSRPGKEMPEKPFLSFEGICLTEQAIKPLDEIIKEYVERAY